MSLKQPNIDHVLLFLYLRHRSFLNFIVVFVYLVNRFKRVSETKKPGFGCFCSLMRSCESENKA